MSDRFPLRPDRDWYDSMRARYGDAVPDIARLHIRRGLQLHVGDMFEKLHALGLIDKVDIRSVVIRNAAFVVIDSRERDSIFVDDRIALDFLFHGTTSYLNEACEHCGQPGSVIAKAGLEVLLDDPGAALGDRLLCAECYKDWSR